MLITYLVHCSVFKSGRYGDHNLDQSRNVTISVSSEDNSKLGLDEIYNSSNIPGEPYNHVVNFTVPKILQTIKISRNVVGYLTVCEVILNYNGKAYIVIQFNIIEPLK